MRTLATLFTILLVCFGTLTASPASAQDDKARAVELVSAANQSYEAGDFRDALGKYREVYEITEDPRVLYRIGLTYEHLANYQRAREHLELFLLAEPDTSAIDKIQQKIANMKELEAKLQSSILVESTPPGADVWVDILTGKPAGVTPVRLPVGPGTHELLLQKDGFADVEDTVDVEKSTSIERNYDLEGGTAETPVAETETEETAPEGEPEVAETEPEEAEPVFTGEPTKVHIGPTESVAILSWICIGVGWAILAFSGTDTATGGLINPAGPGLANGGFFVGAGLIALGAYFLWIKDYTSELPDARRARRLGVPSSPAAGVTFDF